MDTFPLYPYQPQQYYDPGFADPGHLAMGPGLHTGSRFHPSNQPGGAGRGQGAVQRPFNNGYHRGGANRGRGHGHRGRRYQQPHYNDPVPSLASLQGVNKRKASEFYPGLGAGPTPRTAPRAPQNTNRYLMHYKELNTPIHHENDTPFHALTPNPLDPSTAWQNSYGNMGEAVSLGLKVGIDFFGSNAGFLGGATESQDNDTASDIFDNQAGNEQQGKFQLQHASSAEGQDEKEPGQLQADDAEEEGAGAVDWKERYLEMKEQNMTLREKLEMLEQQLAKYKSKYGRRHSSSGASDEALSDSPQSKDSAGFSRGSEDGSPAAQAQQEMTAS